MIRRSTAMLVAILLCVAVLGGCVRPDGVVDVGEDAASQTAGDSLDPDAPVTVTLWHYYTGENQEKLDAAVEEFNRTTGQERGVIVTAVPKGTLSELEEAVTNSAKGVINAEEMPDIFSCYADQAMELDELGALCDIGSRMSQETLDGYVPEFLDDGIIGGRLLVLPIVKCTELLYVNKTALDEFAAANPGAAAEEQLATWQSLYGLSKAYYEWTDAQTPEQPWDGRGFLGIDELANFLIVSSRQLGVEILDGEDAEVRLDRGVLRQVFDIYFPARALGYFDQVGKFGSDDVKTGDLAAYVGSSSSASYFPTFTESGGEQVDIELLAAAYPVFEGGEPRTAQQGAGMAVAKSDTAREGGACLFLEWFTDPARNVPFAMNTGYLPVTRAAYSSGKFEEAVADLGKESGADARNLEQVYRIALEAVDSGEAYAAKPFRESYSVRSLLKNTLQEAALAGKEAARPLQDSGLGAEEILAELDVDARFDEWLDAVATELDAMGVAHTEG